MTTKRLKAVCALLLVLGTALGLSAFGVFRHPIPEKIDPGDSIVICGHRIQTSSEVMYVTGLADGGTMIFGIKDASGKIYGVVCFFDSRTSASAPIDHFRILKFSEGIPNYDGTTEPILTEITDNSDQVRNFLFYRMKDAGFHRNDSQREMALQLYPSLYQRHVR